MNSDSFSPIWLSVLFRFWIVDSPTPIVGMLGDSITAILTGRSRPPIEIGVEDERRQPAGGSSANDRYAFYAVAHHDLGAVTEMARQVPAIDLIAYAGDRRQPRRWQPNFVGVRR